MKNIRGLWLAVAALIVSASSQAWSQNHETASAPSGAASASGMAAPATGRAANRALRRKVYAAIGKHKEISAGDISVVAKDGAVTLNGTVTDEAQIDKVMEIAKGVPGVISVTNRLSVRKPFGGQ